MLAFFACGILFIYLDLKFYITYVTMIYVENGGTVMKKKLCEQYDISKKCAFCENASKTLDESKMLCKKKGVVNAEYICRSFRYDLMKRVPKRLPVLPK